MKQNQSIWQFSKLQTHERKCSHLKQTETECVPKLEIGLHKPIVINKGPHSLESQGLQHFLMHCDK